MTPALSSQKELTEEEKEAIFKRTFHEAWGKGWNIGFYGNPNIPSPFIDNLTKKWFNWGVEDGLVAKKEFEQQPELDNVTQKTCLRCREKFPSHGNRICSKCEAANAFVENKEPDEE